MTLKTEMDGLFTERPINILGINNDDRQCSEMEKIGVCRKKAWMSILSKPKRREKRYKNWIDLNEKVNQVIKVIQVIRVTEL